MPKAERDKGKRYRLHVCGPHLRVPGKDGECPEAVWSQGRACRKCEHPSCYRVGWGKSNVDADNARLVRENCNGN